MRIVVEGIVDITTDAAGGGVTPVLDGELPALAFLAPTSLTRAERGRARPVDAPPRAPPGRRAPRCSTWSPACSEAVAYEPGITDVSHSAIEALELGSGVCQDQAHVFVACCRAAGIPARYVSGYLFTGRHRRGREPRLGRRLARRRRRLAQPRRDARFDRRRVPLPAGRRPRLPRRRPGARRAPRRRPRAPDRGRAPGRAQRRLDRSRDTSSSEQASGRALQRRRRRAYHPVLRRLPEPDMTYCVAMLLDAGLVFLSDSRTNAGVDQINTFRKTTVFERPGDRVIVLMSAGNLAITQGALNLLAERIAGQKARPTCSTARTCSRPPAASAARCARCTSATPRRCACRASSSTPRSSSAARSRARRRGCSTSTPPATSSRPRRDTTYFQIGESKYGKPIIDRVIRRSMPLSEAAKCALISMDSTIRSQPLGRPAARPRDRPPRRVQHQQPRRHRRRATTTSSASASAGARRCARSSANCRTRTG